MTSRTEFIYSTLLVALFVVVIVFDLPGSIGSYLKADVMQEDMIVEECEFKTRAHLYVPILMYHHVGYSKGFSSYYVSPEIFEEQMKWLKDNKYTVISMDEFDGAVRCGLDLPNKPVVITFDDGDRDQYEYAFPVLRKYGYSGTFYIAINWLEDNIHMTWEMVKDLIDKGMIIGSHTMSHPNLATLYKEGLVYELSLSKKILTEKLGMPIRYISYPGGGYSNFVGDLAKEEGYINGVKTHHAVYHDIKSLDDMFTLSRIHIDNEMPSFVNWIQGIGL